MASRRRDRVSRRLQMGQENQGVNLAHLAVFLVDGADLPGDYEPGRVRPGPLQGIESLLRFGQLVPQLGPPGGVGEVAGAYQADALPSGPGIQRLRLQLLAGGPGVFGVDMQIGDIHAASSPSRFSPFYPFSPWTQAEGYATLEWTGGIAVTLLEAVLELGLDCSPIGLGPGPSQGGYFVRQRA